MNATPQSDFEKVLHLGTGTYGQVFARVEIKDGELSISGVEGPKHNGDCRGSCGQIVMSYLPALPQGFIPAPPFDIASVLEFFKVWDRWHLNKMRAGSQVQEDYLRAHPVKAVYPQSRYDLASKVLAEAGLNPDPSGYKYGHAWKKEELLDEVVVYLKGLPASTITPAWC